MTEAIAGACGPKGYSHAVDSILDLACALEASQLFLGNDSGPNHMAAALGVPAVGIYGPTFEPPINDNAVILSPPLGQGWRPDFWPAVDTVIDTLDRTWARWAPRREAVSGLH